MPINSEAHVNLNLKLDNAAAWKYHMILQILQFNLKYCGGPYACYCMVCL